MSFSGKKTPLLLNVEAEITKKQSFKLNAVAQGYHGIWKPATPYSTPTTGSYVQGTITSTNVLSILTNALPNLYNAATATSTVSGGTTLSVGVWRNALRIGRPIDRSYSAINCPALGNSKPDTFKTSYAGFGSFKASKTTDIFYNEAAGSGQGLVEPIYPPFNYPKEGKYSYIYNNWGSKTPPAGLTEPYQYLNEYAWVTGWPGVYSWQSKAPGNPQNANDPVKNSDTYAAAYYPRPDLAGSQPWRSRDAGKIEYDEYFRHGFIATLSRQAYYEFWSDYSTRRSNQYIEFVKSFQQNSGYQNNTNKKIWSFYNSKTFLKGNFSNINDITTSDVAGVNLAFKNFGNDLINLGKGLDLANIHVFGLPSKFLLNLQTNNALTEPLRLALLYSDLSTTDLEDILLPTYTPSIDQEKKIYNALNLITGTDLNNILVIINCNTQNLSTLADLINPKTMFPNSYKSLTVPRYSTANLSSKIYDFIYLGNGVNTRIQNWGTYLIGILPNDQAIACGAFMMTMNQIKNITQMNCEKLSQVVSNLEVTNKDLQLVNSASGIPSNQELMNEELSLIALGSGSCGSFRFCDFNGAMSGIPYADWYAKSQALIKTLETTELRVIYTKLYQKGLNCKWALISRGKGWANPVINTTGILPYYAYSLFKVQSSSSNMYPCVGVVRDTITINPGGIDNYNICVAATARAAQDTQLPTSDFLTNYQTGQLISFANADNTVLGNSAANNIYVITQVINSTTIKVESTVNIKPRVSLGATTTPPSWTGFPTSATRWYSGDGGNSGIIASGWRYNPCTNNLSNGGFNFVTGVGSLSATREISPGVFETYTAAYVDVTFGNVTSGGDFYEPIPYTGWPGVTSDMALPGQYVYIYEKNIDGYPGNGILTGTTQDLIDAANLEIYRIQTNNPQSVTDLNYWWNNIGTQLWKEQRAIPLAVPKTSQVYEDVGLTDIDAFTRNLEGYSIQNDFGNQAQILEAITDANTIGGQSLIAAMREARNAKRLMNTGAELDNDVNDKSNINTATATGEVDTCPGPLSRVSLINRGSGYDPGAPPNVIILPQTGVFGSCRHSETALNVSTDCTFKAVIADYPNIVNVKVGWTSGYGAVTSAVINGANYEITVSGQCFPLDVFQTFVSPIIAPGTGATATAVVDVTGSISEIQVTNGGGGYCCPPTIIVEDPPKPQRLGESTTSGSFAGSPYTGNDPVSDNLVTTDPTTPPSTVVVTPVNPSDVYTVDEAIESVIICNCDCWDE